MRAVDRLQQCVFAFVHRRQRLAFNALSAHAVARLHNNLAVLAVCDERHVDAETELRRAIEAAPTEVAPRFNRALLLWKCGEHRRACEEWLAFRRRPLGRPASEYEEAARHSGVVDAPPPTSHVSGAVGAEALAAFDRMVLRAYAQMRRDDDFKKNWRGAR